MSAARRLSICYAAPGQRLLGTAGSTRNVLSVAEAMSQWADVTVAFRSIAGAPPSRNFKIIAIDPPGSVAPDVRDNVAVRGLNPFAHAAYLRTLRGFAARASGVSTMWCSRKGGASRAISPARRCIMACRVRSSRMTFAITTNR